MMCSCPILAHVCFVELSLPEKAIECCLTVWADMQVEGESGEDDSEAEVGAENPDWATMQCSYMLSGDFGSGMI